MDNLIRVISQLPIELYYLLPKESRWSKSDPKISKIILNAKKENEPYFKKLSDKELDILEAFAGEEKTAYDLEHKNGMNHATVLIYAKRLQKEGLLQGQSEILNGRNRIIYKTTSEGLYAISKRSHYNVKSFNRLIPIYKATFKECDSPIMNYLYDQLPQRAHLSLYLYGTITAYSLDALAIDLLLYDIEVGPVDKDFVESIGESFSDYLIEYENDRKRAIEFFRNNKDECLKVYSNMLKDAKQAHERTIQDILQDVEKIKKL